MRILIVLNRTRKNSPKKMYKSASLFDLFDDPKFSSPNRSSFFLSMFDDEL